MEGWIKLHRKLIENGWLKNPKLFTFWIYCLLRANHKPMKTMVGYQELQLDPGQFIFGRKKASKEIGLSEQQIRTCIDSLSKAQNLTIKSTNKFSIVSIINWEAYQGGYDCNQPSSQPTTNQQLTTDKNIKNEKKKTLRDSPNPAVKEFLTHFQEAFREKTGQPYTPNWGKEGKLVKDLLKTHPLERLKELTAVFFKSEDPFIQKGGYTIGVFYSLVNKLATVKVGRW